MTTTDRELLDEALRLLRAEQSHKYDVEVWARDRDALLARADARISDTGETVELVLRATYQDGWLVEVESSSHTPRGFAGCFDITATVPLPKVREIPGRVEEVRDGQT